MAPLPLEVREVRRDLADVVTFELRPGAGRTASFAPGQFNMLFILGAGEVPISISGDPAASDRWVHTVRDVGPVSAALCRVEPGQRIGLRGPFGTAWPVDSAQGGPVVFVAGGLGLAPLRPAIYRVLADRARFGRVVLLYGARTPRDVLYAQELEDWTRSGAIEVRITVDRAEPPYAGEVGPVTHLIPKASLEPGTTAFVCGPEIMMRFTAEKLLDICGPERTWVSLERNMKCAVGFCGHCQFGPHFICKDGPVFSYDRVRRLLGIREI